ncbi:MAG: M48 family metallopeptidase [Verrucomicrobiales bacterium]
MKCFRQLRQLRQLRQRLPLSLALLPVLLYACGGANLINPETGEVRTEATSPELIQEGNEAFRKYRMLNPVSHDAALNARVNRIANRLKPVVNLPGVEWDFVVFQDKTANAFALPGGKVGINTGILSLAENDHQLATVIAHEMAHVSANHAQSRLHRQKVIGVGSALFGTLLGGAAEGASYQELAQTGGQIVFGLPFSRSQELEADKIGLIYMAKAGYDPAESVKLWQAMAAQDGSHQLAFMSTHPVNESRIAAIRDFLPTARQYAR